ncbi:MAG TPA: CapA family protein [Acidobacteriota bacterium]|nr:CapA family protein [Acidobacteriota bacterium]
MKAHVRCLVVLTISLALIGGPGAMNLMAQDSETRQELLDPLRPLEAEIATSIDDGFTFAAVGDCIIARPQSQMLETDPAFAAAMKIIREADVSIGNLETSLIDIRRFAGYPEAEDGGCWCLATPQTAQDLKDLGFDMFSRANNHTLDWGRAGMRETSGWLDRAGLVHAGSGEHRAEARTPRFLETPKGRVGLVSVASTFAEFSEAAPPRGAAPGRPGLNVLKTTRHTVVTEPMMRSLVDLRHAANEQRRLNDVDTARADESSDSDSYETSAGTQPGASAPRVPEQLRLFNTSFRLGEAPGFNYEMDEVDLRENLHYVREGKQLSDFLVVSIHVHETGLGHDELADFLPTFARATIDAGADVFVGTGTHRLRPIEIYKGRPIFYGLGDFFWSDIQGPFGNDYYERYADDIDKTFGEGYDVTEAEMFLMLAGPQSGFNDEFVYQTVVPVSRYEGGQLAELRLYPVDLGHGRRLTESGVPRLAEPAVAQVILQRLAKMSAPFGTMIAIEGNVGVVRP